MKRGLYEAAPDGGSAVLVAEFSLEAGKLEATYHSPEWQRYLKDAGIWVEPDGALYPEDGAAFFNALPIAFRQSSRVWVEELPG